jgi:3-phosphoshikimate 1-carboxyvinyltransferase
MNVEILPRKGNDWGQSLPAPSISLPPDKSIFHRFLIIGSMTESLIRIPIPSIEEIPVDVYATILALQSLGVPIELARSEIILKGVGRDGFHAPKHQINCGNSGTTARLLMGLLAGQNFSTILTGDQSLSQRPMKRLADLLNSELGADIGTSASGSMPIIIHGKKIHGGNVELPASSAQMKSAVLIAGIYASGEVSVTEPMQSRDHTERMLESFGTGFSASEKTISKIENYSFTTPQEFTYNIPGDTSSAAFLYGASIASRRNIILKNVGLNPTRSRFMPILEASGLMEEVSNIEYKEGKGQRSSGDVELFSFESNVRHPFVFFGDESPLIIDEIPLLAVLASFLEGDTVFNDLGELRKKESDRIQALVKNFSAFGVSIDETKDGFVVHGDPEFIPAGGSVDHFGDHRIAMAFSVLALRAHEPVTISEAEVVSVSYPNFFKDLGVIVGKDRIRIS